MIDTKNMMPQRPLLRYFGGKWKIAKWVIEHLPTHRTYCEPFGGAASVLLQKRRSHTEVYNDLNDDVVELFRVMQDREAASELHRRLHYTPFSRAEWQLSGEASDDRIERARRLIVGSYMSYAGKGGIERSMNRSGFKPITPGSQGSSIARVWKTYSEHFEALIERLRGVTIENIDALTLITRLDAAKRSEETLFYVDPPYVISSRSSGKAEYVHEMDEAAHIRLADTLWSTKGMVVVSGYDSTLYDKLYAGWERKELKVQQMNVLHTEVLWLSPSTSVKLKRQEKIEFDAA